MARRYVVALLVGVIATLGLGVVPAPTASAAAPTYQVAQQISLPASGSGVAVDPARGLVYVAGRGSEAVWVYDEATLTLQHTIAVPNQPYNLAVGPAGLVYVSQYTGNSTQGFVSVIDPATNTIVATLPTGLSPVGVTVSHDGTRLYVANYSSDFLSVYDLSVPASPTVLPNISLPGGSDNILESPDGTRLFVASGTASVYVVATATGSLAETWTGFNSPHQVTLSTDGTQAFVSQQLGGPMPIFSVATNTQTGTIPLSTTYYQATDAMLGTGFVTQPFTAGGTLAVIDMGSGAVLQSLTAVTGAYYPAVDPLTHSVFVTSITSSTLTKVTTSVPVVTSNPASQIVYDGTTATFTAAATGTGPITVQWESSPDGGSTWQAIAGATDTSYTTAQTSLTDDDTLFRAVFTDSADVSVRTTAATLTVIPVPVTIVTDPVSQTVAPGETVTFTATATGSSPITVQWQASKDGGTVWSDIPEATSTSYTLADAAASDDGALFRAVFTGPGPNNTAIGGAATLTVTAVTPPPTPSPSSTTAPSPSSTATLSPSSTTASSGPAATNLARTGSTVPAGAILAAALILLAAGAAMIAVRRRRLRH